MMQISRQLCGPKSKSQVVTSTCRDSVRNRTRPSRPWLKAAGLATWLGSCPSSAVLRETGQLPPHHPQRPLLLGDSHSINGQLQIRTYLRRKPVFHSDFAFLLWQIMHYRTSAECRSPRMLKNLLLTPHCRVFSKGARVHAHGTMLPVTNRGGITSLLMPDIHTTESHNSDVKSERNRRLQQ